MAEIAYRVGHETHRSSYVRGASCRPEVGFTALGIRCRNHRHKGAIFTRRRRAEPTRIFVAHRIGTRMQWGAESAAKCIDADRCHNDAQEFDEVRIVQALCLCVFEPGPSKATGVGRDAVDDIDRHIRKQVISPIETLVFPRCMFRAQRLFAVVAESAVESRPRLGGNCDALASAPPGPGRC